MVLTKIGRSNLVAFQTSKNGPVAGRHDFDAKLVDNTPKQLKVLSRHH
jgi:hypothetical protein